MMMIILKQYIECLEIIKVKWKIEENIIKINFNKSLYKTIGMKFLNYFTIKEYYVWFININQ